MRHAKDSFHNVTRHSHTKTEECESDCQINGQMCNLHTATTSQRRHVTGSQYCLGTKLKTKAIWPLYLRD